MLKIIKSIEFTIEPQKTKAGVNGNSMVGDNKVIN